MSEPTREEKIAAMNATPNQTLAALAAMEQEQREEYEDYVRRCGGVPISDVKP